MSVPGRAVTGGPTFRPMHVAEPRRHERRIERGLICMAVALAMLLVNEMLTRAETVMLVGVAAIAAAASFVLVSAVRARID